MAANRGYGLNPSIQQEFLSNTVVLKWWHGQIVKRGSLNNIRRPTLVTQWPSLWLSSGINTASSSMTVIPIRSQALPTWKYSWHGNPRESLLRYDDHCKRWQTLTVSWSFSFKLEIKSAILPATRLFGTTPPYLFHFTPLFFSFDKSFDLLLLAVRWSRLDISWCGGQNQRVKLRYMLYVSSIYVEKKPIWDKTFCKHSSIFWDWDRCTVDVIRIECVDAT